MLTEAQLEEKLMNQLVTQGYERVSIKDEESLIENFKIQIEKFNNITLSNSEFNKIQIYLAGGSIFEKAKKLRRKFLLIRDNGDKKYISFLDDENKERNIFQVVNQITMKEIYENRYDVTILVNGLPLVQIELKKNGIGLRKAFYQVQRYQRHSYKNLFQYIQIFIISNEENTRYFSNNSELKYEFTFFWTDERNNRKNRIEEFTEMFLDKKHLLDMITKYIVINETQKYLMILRPYQYYAVEKIIDTVKDTPEKNGYIWHTTGSGKTLTSFKASQILATYNEIDKVVFCVDRKDLDAQTIKEFNAFSRGSVDKIENTKEFVDNMVETTKKVVVTTIQKLNNAISKPYHLKQMEKMKDKRVVFIFDECHRTQFGETHSKISEFFINKQFFGFTGTPIFEENSINYRTTKDLFEECLHRYTIKEAIDDENVLGFSVEYYSTFNLKDKDGYDMSPDDMKVKGINTKEVFSNKERLGNIVDFIIKNHRAKTFNKKFQSIFAVSDINTLIDYYHLFKEKNNDLKIAAIFTYGANVDLSNDEGTFEVEGDECKHPREHLDEIVEDYNKMFGTNFNLNIENGFNSYFTNISEKVRERKIDILLVVNMFLTGFDSKYLNTLYVDKNLRFHGLIQAYSRTNRILGVDKSHGNIVCFRNLKERTDEAIRLFSDPNAVETVLMKDYSEYLEDFNISVENLREIAPTPPDVDNLHTEENKLKFIKIYKNMIRLMNRLTTFSIFTFDDLNITQDEYIRYQTKYLDLHGNTSQNRGKGETIIDEVDFEIELLKKDEINVTYIISLLKNLDNKESSFIKDIDFIIKIIDSSPTLKSKKELVENFIKENREIFDNESNVDIEDKFEKYIEEQRKKAIDKMIKDEELNNKLVYNIFEEYEFHDKDVNTGIIRNSFLKQPSIFALGDKIKNVQNKINNIIEKFSLR